MSSMAHPHIQQLRSKQDEEGSSPEPSSRPFLPSPSLPPHISVLSLTSSTLPSFRRIISLLLPIRYPDTFYSEILSDPTVSSLARVAIWHTHPQPRDHISTSTPPGQVVGAIRCRVETHPSASGQSPHQHHLYIQALALLSPYRSNGIATHLLTTVASSALSLYPDLVSVYAHVWEANEEGLEWYMRRGFVLEEDVIAGYYRRLRPSGARVVRRVIRVRDWLTMDAKRDTSARRSVERDEADDRPQTAGGELVDSSG